jgi:hypothetical protein
MAFCDLADVTAEGLSDHSKIPFNLFDLRVVPRTLV